MRIGRIANIELVIHPTFWLILGFVAWTVARTGGDMAAIGLELLFVSTIFGCVVLHELGHALAARRYGIGTESITLYPIGGIARLERMPDKPVQELVVALAGPAVNVVIAALVGVALLAVESPFLVRLAVVNVVLVLFNMLPAFPMDGGRVLRALLAMRMPMLRATRLAAGVGKVMVVPFVVAGLFWNPFLVLIGLFVWFGGSAETRAVMMRESLGGARVMQASTSGFYVLRPHGTLNDAVQLTLETPQRDFPVMQDGEIVGVLSQKRLLEALEQRGPQTAVSEVMDVSPPSVAAQDRLQDAVGKMQQAKSPFLPVTDRGRPVGILTRDSVEAFAHMRKAFGGAFPIRIDRRLLAGEPSSSLPIPPGEGATA